MATSQIGRLQVEVNKRENIIQNIQHLKQQINSETTRLHNCNNAIAKMLDIPEGQEIEDEVNRVRTIADLWFSPGE